MSLLGRVLREPLLHFALLAALVLAVERRVVPPSPRRIVVTADELRGLRQEHRRRTGADPTPADEEALLARFLDDEVLYREALALGLDRGDVIIRRRLIQKMQFLTEDMSPVAEPTDADLDAYLASHRQRYATLDRVSLTHVFFTPYRPDDDVEARATDARAQLVAGIDPTTLGDPFVRGRDFVLETAPELAAVFGPAFATAVMALPVGEWSAPIRSSYGVHLVRVKERRAAQGLGVAELRDRLRRDWQEERRASANQAALARLRAQYEIDVEREAPAR